VTVEGWGEEKYAEGIRCETENMDERGGEGKEKILSSNFTPPLNPPHPHPAASTLPRIWSSIHSRVGTSKIPFQNSACPAGYA